MTREQPLAVLGFACRLHVRLAFQKLLQTIPDNGMVVGDEDSDFFHDPLLQNRDAGPDRGSLPGNGGDINRAVAGSNPLSHAQQADTAVLTDR